MVALVGDAELDEGNIFEALLEGWKQGLRNCWWIIDYNRQSLDAVVREGLWERYEQLFKNFGWDVVIVKYGSLQQAAFKEPGGDKLRHWIDNCPNQLYSALVFAGGAAWRKRLTDEIGDQGDVTRLIEKRSRRRARRADEQSRRPRSAVVLEAFHGADHRPADLLHLLHHQGLRPAVRRPQGQPRRPDDAGADGGFPQGDGRAAGPRMGQVRGPRAAGRTLAEIPRRACRSPQGATRRLEARRKSTVPDELPVTIAAGDVDADRLRRDPQRDRPRRQRLRAPHRHHLAGRHRLDQSRTLGEPARAVRARGDGRHLQERAHPFDLQLGILAARASTSSSASPR